MKKIILILSLLISFGPNTSYTQTVIDKSQETIFINLANQKNTELIIARKKLNARLSLLGSERKSRLSTKLFADTALTASKQGVDSPLYSVEESQIVNLKAGIQKTFLNGLVFKVGHETTKVKQIDSRLLNVSTFSYTAPTSVSVYEQSPFAELTLPLWRGFNGETFKSELELLDIENDSEVLQLESQIDDKQNQLKILFWSIALKLHNIELLESSNKRIYKILNFVKRKVDLKIDEPGTLYQLQALIKNNESNLIVLRSELDDLISNSEREELPIDLSFYQFNAKEIDEKTYLNETKISGSLKLKILNLRRENELLRMKTLSSAPELNFFMKTSFKKSDAKLGKSFEDYPETKRPNVMVGFNFLTDLDFSNMSNQKDSFKIVSLSNSELETSDLKYALKEKASLSKRLSSSYQAYMSSRELSAIQLQKLNNERRLLDLGRSSIFQVLQYEQDYIFAEESLYRKVLEIKNIENRLALYKYDIKGDL